MEKQREEEATGETADSGGAASAGELPQAAGAREARSEDRIKLLLRWFPPPAAARALGIRLGAPPLLGRTGIRTQDRSLKGPEPQCIVP
jgi:hypothetical protein